MCGRYSLARPIESVMTRFEVQPTGPLEPNTNASPTQALPIITSEEPHLLVQAQWGLVPGWAKDLSMGNKMFNARSETLEEKPSFRSLVGRRRCLVPADGFYEWKAEGGRKQPYRIAPAQGGLFAFAGLWDVWAGPSGEHAYMTFTIITTEANRQMRELHERMPLILERGQEALWLNRRTAPDAIRNLIHRQPGMELRIEALQPNPPKIPAETKKPKPPGGQLSLFD